MLHRYAVEWSAPDYHNSGMGYVMAGNAPGAVSRMKKKLGNKVKQQHLTRFRAWKHTATHAHKMTQPRYVG